MQAPDRDELRQAKLLLENPGLAAKIASVIGSPVEKGFDMLPANWQGRIGVLTQDALLYALKGALSTMSHSASTESHPKLHKLFATLSGTASGAFGLPGLAVDLPLSTLIMLRSIADIARANGESLQSAEVRLACLQVFAMGGAARADDAAESGYFAVRTALARAVSEASGYLARQAVADELPPALVRLITLIAARFQVQVTEKAAAVLVPVAGAIGGGAINLLFIDHFQDMSRGHFTVRRLERKYGEQLVRKEYEALDARVGKAEAQAA